MQCSDESTSQGMMMSTPKAPQHQQIAQYAHTIFSWESGLPRHFPMECVTSNAVNARANRINSNNPILQIRYFSFGTFLELPVPLGRILVVVIVIDRNFLALRNVSTRYDTHDEPVSRMHWGLQEAGVGLIWRKAI